MQSRDSRGTAPLRQRWFIYAAGKGAYNLELWLFGLEEDREVGSAWLKFTDREVPNLGCSEPGLVMKNLSRILLLSHFLKRMWKGAASKVRAAVGRSEMRCSCTGWKSETMEWMDFYRHGPGAAPTKVSEEEREETLGELKLKIKGK